MIFLGNMDLVRHILNPNSVPADLLWSPWLIIAAATLAVAVFGLWVWLLVSRKLGTNAPDWRKPADFGIDAPELLMLLVAVIGLWFCAGLIVAGIRDSGSLEGVELEHMAQTLAMGFALVGVGGFLILTAMSSRGIPTSMRPESKKMESLPVIFVAWFPLTLALGWLSFGITLTYSDEFEMQAVLENAIKPSSWQLPALLVGILIGAPIAEEFVFRAGIQGYLRRHTGFWVAALIPLALWGALHNPFEQPHVLVPVVGLGLVLAWVYERSGNIWYSIALHAMHNGFVLLLNMSTFWQQ